MSRSAVAQPMPTAPRFHLATGLFRAATWRGFAFQAVHLPIAVAAAGWFILTLAVGLPVAVTVFGVVVSAFLLGGSTWFAAVTRNLSASLLDQVVVAPRPRARRAVPLGWALARIADPSLWRSFAYLLVGFVVTTCSFAVSTVLLVTAVGAVTHAVWGRFLPAQVGVDGRSHRGARFFDTFVDTVPTQLTFAAVGLVLLVVVWPVVNGALASLQRVVIRSMLGTSRGSERLAAVTASRDAAVVDADATLRRIERELHDGTQARLVGLAMTLGDARDRLQHGPGDDGVQTLVEQAHAATKDALVELRALARGIHPPVLDAGLEAALASACSRTPFPVQLRTDLPVRPAPVVEGIVYFGVLELLTNVSKHAEASSVLVDVALRDGGVVATVVDDGVGGAHVALPGADGHGSGLSGLLERLRAVDGTLRVHSPIGGPTTVCLSVPAGVAA